MIAAGDEVREAAIPFAAYARYYDLLYSDKDYAAEADYVARTIQSAAPDTRSILELGSGTGRHGRLLAAKGFNVWGVERSPDMVALAGSASTSRTGTRGTFNCTVGDARSIDFGRMFGAVIALFHVVSYQASDADLQAIFAAAARHLVPGGVFLFDVWHGPAVLAQRQERREKRVADGKLEVIRTARPQIDTDRNTVQVNYEIECRERDTGAVERFAEDHLIRYLFPNEIERLAAQCGMRVVRTEEFLTAQPPSPATWSVAYLLRKRVPIQLAANK